MEFLLTALFLGLGLMMVGVAIGAARLPRRSSEKEPAPVRERIAAAVKAADTPPSQTIVRRKPRRDKKATAPIFPQGVKYVTLTGRKVRATAFGPADGRGRVPVSVTGLAGMFRARSGSVRFASA